MQITLKEFKELIKKIIKEESIYDYDDLPDFGDKRGTGDIKHRKYNIDNPNKKGIYNLKNIAIGFVNTMEMLSKLPKFDEHIFFYNDKRNDYIDKTLDVLHSIFDHMGYRNTNKFFNDIKNAYGSKSHLMLGEIIAHLYLTHSLENDVVTRETSQNEKIVINGEFKILNHDAIKKFLSMSNSYTFLAAYNRFSIGMPIMYQRSGDANMYRLIKKELTSLLSNTIYGKTDTAEKRAKHLMDVQKTYIENVKRRLTPNKIAQSLYKYELENLKR